MTNSVLPYDAHFFVYLKRVGALPLPWQMASCSWGVHPVGAENGTKPPGVVDRCECVAISIANTPNRGNP